MTEPGETIPSKHPPTFRSRADTNDEVRDQLRNQLVTNGNRLNLNHGEFELASYRKNKNVSLKQPKPEFMDGEDPIDGVGSRHTHSPSIFDGNQLHSTKTLTTMASQKERKSIIDQIEEHFERESIDIAAFAHVLGWAESAEMIKNLVAEQDDELIQNSGFMTKTLIECCCPRNLCCARGSPPLLQNNSEFSNKYIYARHAQQKYRMCCCCCCFKQMTITTSMFIWHDLPLIAVKFRLVLLFQISIQIMTTIFQWIFLISLLQSEYGSDSNRDVNQLKIPSSVVHFVASVFFLPDIVHAIYITEAPGYHLRSVKRKIKQVCYSLLSQFGLRPIYDLLWSFKFTGLMPYVTLQNQGSIVTDSGVHERFVVWMGLATTMREMPLRLCQLYILMEYFPFWGDNFMDKKNGLPDFFALSSYFFGTGSKSMQSQLRACTSTDVDENSILMSLFVGLLASGMALSDQLERELPYGAFPRRFSRVLAGDLWGTPALLWTFILMVGFFVDLFLRFSVLVPLCCIEGLSFALVGLLCFSILPSLLCFFMMTDRCDKKEEESLAFQRRGSDADMRKIKIRESNLGMLTTKTSLQVISADAPKRGGTDTYDDGMRLDVLDSAPSANCFGCKSEKRSKKVGNFIETFPFLMWTVWVDLPLRLKWLRLSEQSNNKSSSVYMCCLGQVTKTLAFYLYTSMNTFVLVCVIYAYNYSSLQQSMATSIVSCNKTIPTECTPIHQRDNVTCPMNMTDTFRSEYRLNGLMGANSSWRFGCLDNRGIHCMPELDMHGPNAYNSLYFGAEGARWLLDAHEPIFFLRPGHTPLFPTVLFLMLLKLIVTVLVTWQFFLVPQKIRGQFQCWCQRRLLWWKIFRKLCCFWLCCCLCCCGKMEEDEDEEEEEEDENEENDEDNYSVHNRKVKQSHPSSADIVATSSISSARKTMSTLRVHTRARDGLWRRRASRQKKLREVYKAWVSELRARDIQLMLRMSSIMPSAKKWLRVTQEQLEQVEAAKYILGKGGNVYDETFDGVVGTIARAVSSGDSTTDDAAEKSTPDEEDKKNGGMATSQYHKRQLFPTLRQLTAVAQERKQQRLKKSKLCEEDDSEEIGRVMTFMGPGVAVSRGLFVEVELDWRLAHGRGAMLVTLRKNVEKIIHQKGVGSIEIKVEEENLYRDADATMMRQRKKKAAIKTTLSTVAEIE